MIKAIYSEYVYNLLVALWLSIELYSSIPDENATPDTTYGFTQIVSDNIVSQSSQGYYLKQCRVSLTIVCKKVLLATDTPERILRWVIDTTTNLLKATKTHSTDWMTLNSVKEDTVSPIFNQDERYFIVKDYIFNYSSTYDE